LLIKELNWTNVISSKFLHFLCRSLDFENPPVPIDNAVIIQKVWSRIFLPRIDKEEINELKWDDRKHSFQSYNRYMTAINNWAERRGWTTTEVENSLFRCFYRDNL
jgi:hypothetical protein